MTPDQVALLAAAVLAVAFLYSSVGQAGASGYIAVMSLFGLAPGVILLMLHPGEDLVLGAAAIYAVAAAFRLARFNLRKTGETAGASYAGVPVPAAAFVLLATVVTSRSDGHVGEPVSIDVASGSNGKTELGSRLVAFRGPAGGLRETGG